MNTSRFRSAAAIGTLLLLVSPAVATAQGYHVRLDARFQTAAFRGVILDSVPAADVVVNPDGVLENPAGFVVRCLAGRAYCTFFRPGDDQKGGPAVSTIDVRLWGLGVPGLQVRAQSRFGADLGDTDAWPGTDPALQLLQGYLEYSSQRVTTQVGRTFDVSRFGFVGFDGARADVRPLSRLRVAAYGGWGLARSSALPVSSPALNPLDDAQPRRRQALGGASVAWSAARVGGRVVYQREWAPGSGDIVSERVGMEGRIEPVAGLRLTGGADIDLAAGWWGSAEATATYAEPGGRGQVVIEGRRYRPHFDLWTIWGAFTPVPYHAVSGALTLVPVQGLQLEGRGEIYEFDDSEAAVPLIEVEQNGWRWSGSATYSRGRWGVRLGAHREHGPGAASTGFEGALTVAPVAPLSVSLHGGRLRRPLEFRVNDAKVWSYGGSVSLRLARHFRADASVSRYDEARRRPDAAQFDWNQLRLSVGATMTWGSSVGRSSLPPAVLQIPTRRAER